MKRLGVSWILMVLGMAVLGWILIGTTLMELYNLFGWEAAAAVGVTAILWFSVFMEEELKDA